MKKTTVLFFVILLVTSLACLETAAAAISVEKADASVTESIVPTATLTLTPALSLKGEGGKCAQVIAIEALHLRNGANEKAVVLDWLRHGDVVQVIDQSEGDWWFVQHAGINGYARMKYLQEMECK